MLTMVNIPAFGMTVSLKHIFHEHLRNIRTYGPHAINSNDHTHLTATSPQRSTVMNGPAILAPAGTHALTFANVLPFPEYPERGQAIGTFMRTFERA